MAPLCKLAGVSSRLVVTERAGHAQHMLQVSDPHHGGNYDGGGDGVDGGDDVCWHAYTQHMLQVSAYHGDDCGGDCCGDCDGGGGDDVCWHAHAQHLLQVSASYGDDCGGDCCGDYYLIFRPSHWLNLME